MMHFATQWVINWQWFIIIIYGIVGALFSYCVALIFRTPLAAFAAVAGFQAVMFMVCLVLNFHAISQRWLCRSSTLQDTC